MDALKICKGRLTQGLACIEWAIVLSFWAQASPGVFTVSWCFCVELLS